MNATASVTMSERLKEYVSLYGRETWPLSYYAGNVATIENYIDPLIGHIKLTDISTRHLEKYYQDLLTYTEVPNPATGKPAHKYVTAATVGRIHKLLKCCFNQAVKWELMEKNPAFYATVPKYKAKKREIWDADTLMKTLDLCENERLKLAISLTFAATLRIGELLALTWDCTDISEEAINENRAYISIEKELQRVDKDALRILSNKDVFLVFPESASKNVKLFIQRAEPDLPFARMISNEENRLGRSLSINSLLILSVLQNLRGASLHELSEKIHVNEIRTKANVEKLVEAGLVEAIGNTSARTYILSSKVYREQENTVGYVRQTGIEMIKYEELIMKLAKNQEGRVTRENVVDLLGINPPQAYRMLKRLVANGKLNLVGSGRAAHYEIK